MAKKKHNVLVGDVFCIKITDSNNHSYGQVISVEGIAECIIIFDISSNVHQDVNEIVKKPILFLAHTVTVRIEDNIWGVIGNTDLPQQLSLPEYISETLDGFVVLNYKGEIVRNAVEKDKENLSTLKSCSPEIIEDAVNAKYGNGEWYPYLDKFLYKK